FERSLPAEEGDDQDRIDKKEGDAEAREVAAHERRAFDRNGRLLALGKLARLQPGLSKGNEQETANGGQHDDDGQRTPALLQHQFIVDVLIGLETDDEAEEAQRQKTGEEPFTNGPAKKGIRA